MAAPATIIDVEKIPELRRVAETVRGTGEPIVLTAGADELAIVVPVKQDDAGTATPSRQVNVESAMAAAGRWRGIIDDVD